MIEIGILTPFDRRGFPDLPRNVPAPNTTILTKHLDPFY
jgi:hypothetical protein